MTLDSSINIVYVGAGAITFGLPVASWNHSIRVEKALGKRLNIVAIIDPNKQRVDSILKEKATTEYGFGYANTLHFMNIADAYVVLKDHQIDLFIIGAPPFFRGTTLPKKDIELELVRLFGTGPTYFTEKPVSSLRPEHPLAVSQKLKELGVDVKAFGVGYMTRYLKVVQKAISIIKEKNLTIMCVVARYAMAYESSVNLEWWKKSSEGGPAVEQMTHFCDLLRYIVGEVDDDSVNVATVEQDEEAGKLSHLRIDESKVAVNDRVPRTTSVSWKFENGAVGSFTHIVALHGRFYSDEVAIFADGYQIRIQNVYSKPTLYVRSPEDDLVEQVYVYEEDDAFLNEMKAFLSVAAYRSGKPGLDGDVPITQILTSYDDACKTYALTWKIRDKSDKFTENYKLKKQNRGA
jgi:predicted dehydrogenase